MNIYIIQLSDINILWIFHFHCLCFKMPIPSHFGQDFLGFAPKCSQILLRPQKAHFCWKCMFWHVDHPDSPEMQLGRMAKKVIKQKQKKRK